MLIGSCGQKAGEGVDDREQAAKSHPAGRRHHVLLGNPAFDETLGQLGLERLDPAVRQQVGIQHDDVRAPPGDREQFVTVSDDETLGLQRRNRAGSGTC